MTLEKQRIAIAEACGWKFLKHRKSWNWWNKKKCEYLCVCPDYLNDLNAMHEAEKTLTDEQYFSDVLAAYEDCTFTGWLFRIMVRRVDDPDFRTHSATAAQRAEAFLRTIGKWEGKS